MNIKLTLGERLKDLRVERNLKLETLAEQTGLSKSALSKYESDDVTDLSIYAVTTLAEFYGVTTDYLLGVTENKKRPDAVLSDLHLSDGAVDVLRNGKFNHRLLCELLEHPDFSRWMTDLEICVDGLVSDQHPGYECHGGSHPAGTGKAIPCRCRGPDHADAEGGADQRGRIFRADPL